MNDVSTLRRGEGDRMLFVFLIPLCILGPESLRYSKGLNSSTDGRIQLEMREL